MQLKTFDKTVTPRGGILYETMVKRINKVGYLFISFDHYVVDNACDMIRMAKAAVWVRSREKYPYFGGP